MCYIRDVLNRGLRPRTGGSVQERALPTPEVYNRTWYHGYFFPGNLGPTGQDASVMRNALVSEVTSLLFTSTCISHAVVLGT